MGEPVSVGDVWRDDGLKYPGWGTRRLRVEKIDPTSERAWCFSFYPQGPAHLRERGTHVWLRLERFKAKTMHREAPNA